MSHLTTSSKRTTIDGVYFNLHMWLSLFAVRWQIKSHFEKGRHFRDWPLAGIGINRPNKGVALNKGDNANSCSATCLRNYISNFYT